MRKVAVFICTIGILLTAGCAGLPEGLPIDIGGGFGGGDQIGLFTRSVGAVFKAARDITDDQEYYLGRAASAQIMAVPAYSKVYELDSGTEKRPVTRYINHIGHTLVLVSERPETYGGYHFVVIDNPELNAFAVPGGNISITTGLLNIARSEDEIAAVLAHEIAHVAKKHGIGAIKSSRWQGATATILLESAKEYGSEDLGFLLDSFQGAVEDIKNTLIYNTYSPARENEADAEGVSILARAGYDPSAMVSILERLNKITSEDQKGGWMKEHATFETRIENIKKAIQEAKLQGGFPSSRKARYTRVMASLEKKE